MRKLKICYLIVSPYYGGAVTVVSYLIEGLNKNKYDISLVYDSSYPEVDLRLKNSKLFPLRIRGWGFILDFFKLYMILRKEKFDIVHSHNTKTHIVGMLLAFLAKIPLRICTIHEDLFGILESKKKNNFLIISVYKLIFSLTDIIVCVSNSTLEKNKALFTNSKTCVIRNGYDSNYYVDKLNNLTLKQTMNTNIIITYIGRIAEEKGLHILIEAVKLIDRKKDLTVQIIGGSYNDSYYNKITELISKYDLQNIHFYGVLKNFSALLSKTDIVVVPSLIESMGYSILDAWYYKKAVIASDIDGIPEVITNDRDGLLFMHNNAADLAQKIEYLIQKPGIRIRLGENGFSKLKEKYSAVNFLKNMEDIYLSGISKSI